MKSRDALLLMACLTGPALVSGQNESRLPAPKELIAPDIPGVIKGGTKVVLIRDGFKGGEGAIAMPDGSLLFTEQDAHRIIKIDKDDRISTYLENTNRTIGLAYDPKGRLIGTQSMDPMIGVLAPTRALLADSFQGHRFGRPNDLVIDRHGGIYFSDPTGIDFSDPTRGGGAKPGAPPARKPLLFYIRPDGQVTMASDALQYPNGVQLSPDGKTVYATNGTAILAFDVQPDGQLTNARTFAKSAGDGMAVDNEGRLYAALSRRWHPVGEVQGVRVFSAQGQVLGIIPTGVAPSSVAFAGPDKRTLYIVGRSGVQKAQMLAQGIQGRAK